MMAVVSVLSVRGQVPDNDAIRMAVSDHNSEFYYPNLLARYYKGDTTLTRQDYHYLYYGFAFQDEYTPLDPIPGEVDVLMILENNRELSRDDAENIIYQASKVMQKDPFNLSNINFMTYAYSILGDKEREKISAMRLQMVFETIDSSGTGDSEKSAWHVLFFSHVNDFLAIKGFEARSRRIVSRSVEYVTLKNPMKKNKGVYFDYSRAYSKPPTHMPEKPKGIKPRL